MGQIVKINGVTYDVEGEVHIPLAEDTTKEVVYSYTDDMTAEAQHITKGYMAMVKGKVVNGTHTDPTITLTDGVLTIR